MYACALCVEYLAGSRVTHLRRQVLYRGGGQGRWLENFTRMEDPQGSEVPQGELGHGYDSDAGERR